MYKATPLSPILYAKILGSGGSVTAAAVLAAMEAMTDAQAEDALDAIGGEATPTTVTDLSSTSITLASAADNTIYEYGELTALTITAITNPGSFIVRFTSGSTPTTTNFPASMVFPEAFSAEASTRYEINVSNGYALAVGWAVR